MFGFLGVPMKKWKNLKVLAGSDGEKVLFVDFSYFLLSLGHKLHSRDGFLLLNASAIEQN